MRGVRRYIVLAAQLGAGSRNSEIRFRRVGADAWEWTEYDPAMDITVNTTLDREAVQRWIGWLSNADDMPVCDPPDPTWPKP